MASGDTTQRLSRRSLLKTGLVGAAAVALGGTALAMRGTKLRGQAPQKLAVLTAAEYAVLAAVASRICPAAGPGAPGADALGVALAADKLLASAPDDAKKGIKLALNVFESALTGALFGERVAPFTSLSDDEQDAVLRAWRDSSVGFRRTVFHGLHGLVSSLYWGDERTWPRTGYPGPPDPKALRDVYAENLVDLASLRVRSGSGG